MEPAPEAEGRILEIQTRIQAMDLTVSNTVNLKGEETSEGTICQVDVVGNLVEEAIAINNILILDPNSPAILTTNASLEGEISQVDLDPSMILPMKVLMVEFDSSSDNNVEDPSPISTRTDRAVRTVDFLLLVSQLSRISITKTRMLTLVVRLPIEEKTK